MKNGKLSFESHSRLHKGLKYMSVVLLAFPSPEIWYMEKIILNFRPREYYTKVLNFGSGE